jgi:hypothetical protein
MQLVALDFDDTLGAFSALFQKYKDITLFNASPPKMLVEHLLQVHPEYLRPQIMHVLNHLARNRHRCKVVVYTNNQGPVAWVSDVCACLESKLGLKVFDQIIYAYEINGKRVEPKRTTNQKTYKDLLACTKMPPTTQVFFVDDQHHPLMVHANVVYLKIFPHASPNCTLEQPSQDLFARLVRFLQ